MLEQTRLQIAEEAKKNEERNQRTKEQIAEEAKKNEERDQKTKVALERLRLQQEHQRGSVTNAEFYRRVKPQQVLDAWFPLPELEEAVLQQIRSALSKVGDKEKESVQPRMSELITWLHKSLQTPHTIVDAHRAPTFSSRKPDVVAYPSECPQHPLYISWIGELKGCSHSARFADDEMGQLLDMMRVLMNCQPYRLALTGFLSDLRHIQFFRVDRVPQGELTYTQGPVFDLQAQPEAFLALAMWSVEECGLHTPKTPDGTLLTEFLADGSRSRVYAAQHNTGAIVVKYPRFDTDTLEREQEILNLLHEKLEKNLRVFIPGVLAGSTPSCLLLSPKATPLNEASGFSITAVLGLVDLLEAVHALGLAHGDLSWSNIYVLSIDRLMLNDWGSARKLEDQTFSGFTVQFASDNLLRSLERPHDKPFPRQPADDLHALLRCLWLLFFGGLSEVLELMNSGQTENSYAGLRNWWQTRLRPWSGLLAAADSLSY